MANQSETALLYDAPPVRRISWRSIFAGVVVALVLQLTLNLLGLSVGAGVIDPASEQDPLNGIGIGGGIWLVISGVIALFAGGWTAGHLANMPKAMDGILHGILAWGLITLLSFYLMTSAVGNLLSGAANVVGQGMALLGEGVVAAAPEVKQAAQQALDEQDLSLRSIRQEAQELLQQTGSAEEIKDEAQQATQSARRAARDVAVSPGDAQRDLDQALDKVIQSIKQGARAVDTQDLANVIAARTDKSPEEAERIAQRWTQQAQQAIDQAQQAADQVQQAAAQASEKAAATISAAALWAFVALVLGGIAAGVGGMLGSPRRPRGAVAQR